MNPLCRLGVIPKPILLKGTQNFKKSRKKYLYKKYAFIFVLFCFFALWATVQQLTHNELSKQ